SSTQCESARLLPADNSESSSECQSEVDPQSVLKRLYISHTISTWNSRMFEFGAVLFLASIFPGTLLYASIYALVRSFSTVALSSWLGDRVDQSDRLVALRHSIVWQRIPVAASCLCFAYLFSTSGSGVATVLFIVAGFLACLEKLAATVNTVAVERDWAIVISDSIHVPRQELNASMRRIDLFCKLIAPVFISLVDSFSTTVAIWTVFVLNIASVLVEYVTIAHVYRSVPALKRPMAIFQRENSEVTQSSTQKTSSGMNYLRDVISPWKSYVASSVFLASLSLSLLYLTVLSFAGTMVTYLLDSGFTSFEVSCMRIGSIIGELSGTWAAPVIMNRIGPIRSGLWFLNWQLCCLAGATTTFVLCSLNSRLAAAALTIGVALSRVGLWGFDLSAQFLIQENIEEHARARFSTTEIALQSVFEMLSFASTIIWPLPEQFQYPVMISAGAVTVAAACFAAYVRRERGHLLHLSKCMEGSKVYREEIPA
ncbi:hypothetical protein N7495_001804, partial [Penicillium taxi]|uniref:uncharacterized protein n=1 Tax=Penicillium taxi TaxID=168475 RepID=UPI002544F1C5